MHLGPGHPIGKGGSLINGLNAKPKDTSRNWSPILRIHLKHDHRKGWLGLCFSAFPFGRKLGGVLGLHATPFRELHNHALRAAGFGERLGEGRLHDPPAGAEGAEGAGGSGGLSGWKRAGEKEAQTRGKHS